MPKHLKILLSSFFSIILLLGFTETANMVTGFWYQQFLPNLNGRNIVDITFTDSLNGYAITTRLSSTDTSFILKTTNGGDNWLVNHTDSGFIYKRIKFINQNTGYVGGTGLIKTTNGGNSWANVNMSITLEDMFFINVDTGWCAYSESLTGGVFRTTNAGVNWIQQANYGSSNPSKVYFYNRNLGFISEATGQTLRRTSNSGVSWTTFSTAGAFSGDMFFIDSLTGWKSGAPGGPGFRKTTDGGLNWLDQVLPQGGNIGISQITSFSNINKDTLWGVGGIYITPNGLRGMVYRTTNGGDNWLFQIPDTSIHIAQYSFCKFINRNIGWAYATFAGIHTKVGGDTTFLVGVRQISHNVPNQFSLYQNYPNPFNPRTIINYELRITNYVKLSVFDITGRHIIDLVNQKQNAGTYQVDFNGNNYSSGVYFYSLIIDGNRIDTKKMLMIK